MEFAQGDAFGADVAGGEDVFVVGPDGDYVAAVMVKLQAAGGFADAADSVGGLHGLGLSWFCH